jgi:hypothetical protein
MDSSIACEFQAQSKVRFVIMFKEQRTDPCRSTRDEATAYARALNGNYPDTYYYEFNRSYQLVDAAFAPNNDLCTAPPNAAHPAGDPEGQYFKCHSGELYYVFGNVRRLGLPFRDSADLRFEQLVVDSWSSFARTLDPNPDPRFLAARGYVNTSHETQQSSRWKPVKKSYQELRRLQASSYQASFDEQEQCVALGFPLDYYVR